MARPRLFRRHSKAAAPALWGAGPLPTLAPGEFFGGVASGARSRRGRQQLGAAGAVAGRGRARLPLLAPGQPPARAGGDPARPDPRTRLAPEPRAVGLGRRVLGLERARQEPVPARRRAPARPGL